MLQLIHEGHLEGVLALRAANLKEPLIPNSVPLLRCKKVVVDIRTYQGNDFIVVVNFYSKFPKIVMLVRKTAECNAAPEIDVPKSWHSGSTRKRQYAVRNFNNFAEECGNQVHNFEHGVSTVERPKRTHGSGDEEHAEEGER